MVLYFSGTGNSRYVAERIASMLEEEATDIAQFLKENRKGSFTEKGVYVFVAPSYASAMAKPMLDFIRESSFPEGVKAYFVVTCRVSMGITSKFAMALCKEKNFEYMGAEQVVMPQNYLLLFKVSEKEENRKLIEDSFPVIDEIGKLIKGGYQLTGRRLKFLEYPFSVVIWKLYFKFFASARKFYVKEDCISCGKCAHVCPFNNIKIENGRPVWGKHCTHCMACINLCPKMAIEYGGKTKGKLRYPGPYATLK